MAPLDIAAAEAEVARNDELVISAEAAVKNAEDLIRRLIGVPQSSPLWQATLVPVDQPVVEESVIDVDQAIVTAIANRPDLKQQDWLLRSDKVRLAYARNQKLPGLNLDASYGFGGLGGTRIVRTSGGELGGGDIVTTEPGGFGDALDQLFSLDFDTWRVGLTLSLPVFNQLAEANYATALLGVRRDQDVLEQLRQNVEVSVRQLARAVVTNRKRMDATLSARTLQDKRLDAESKKFEHGLSTNFEVQQAQRDLTQARTDEVVAVTDYRRSLAALHQAMGTVLDQHGIVIHE
jgi:outer membrane protein TolC